MALPGKIDLNDLLVFEAVAEAGGFTAAAERLGVATAKVSVEISRLESKLGMALFSRTTRRVALTDAGQTLYEECRPLLRGLSEAVERATSGRNSLGERCASARPWTTHPCPSHLPSLNSHGGIPISRSTCARTIAWSI